MKLEIEILTMQKLQYSLFFFLLGCKYAIHLYSGMHLKGGRERNRETKITQANFHWKETSLNKPKKGE